MLSNFFAAFYTKNQNSWRIAVKKNKSRFLLAVIIITGLILRIYKLGGLSFWFDEAEALLSANLSSIKVAIATHYPLVLYKAFIFLWRMLGENEWMLRMSSVIFGVGCIWAAYYLFSLLFNEKIGLITSLILALSPYHIYYSQELRMYTIISLLTLLSAYFLIRALQNNRSLFWGMYVCVNVFGIYFHPVSIFVVFAGSIFFVLYYGKYKYVLKKWMIAHLSLAFFIFFLVKLMFPAAVCILKKDVLYYKAVVSWVSKISFIKGFYFAFKNFSSGYNAIPFLDVISFIIFLFLAIVGISGGLFSKKRREAVIFSFLYIFFPVFCIYLYSIVKSFYIDRYLITASLFFYAVAAQGIYFIYEKSRKGAVVILAIIVFLSGSSMLNYYANILSLPLAHHAGVQPKKDYRSVSKYISNNFQKNDVIFHSCVSSVLSLEYYITNIFGKDSKYHLHAAREAKNKKIVSLANNNEIKVGNYNIPVCEILYQNNFVSAIAGKRIWLIFSDWEFQPIKGAQSSAGFKDNDFEFKFIVDAMDKYYNRESVKMFDGVTVYLYLNNKKI